MPGARVARDKLQQFAIAPNQEMGRYLEPADRLEVRVSVPVEPVREETLDLIAAVPSGRQADRVDQRKANQRARRPLVAVGRRTSASASQPSAVPAPLHQASERSLIRA